MNDNDISLYLTTNAKYFDGNAIPMLRDRLKMCSEDDLLRLQSCELRDPTMMLLISIFVGGLGIDRFMLGETSMGLLKLFTGGLCGVLTIIDWFSVSKKTKDYNLQRVLAIL